MKAFRMIMTGGIVWALIFSLFTLMGFLPGIKDSQTQQGLIGLIFMAPFAYTGARIYYNRDKQSNGLGVGFVVVSMALMLDALITVPFVEMPQNRGYSDFYSNPFLWLLVAETMTVFYLYWRIRVERAQRV